MDIKTADEAIEAYKSLGDWRYADRESAWKWMFEQGSKAAEADTERLEWLMRNVSGAEFRRLGVTYGGNCGRDRIDAAMKTPNAPHERADEGGPLDAVVGRHVSTDKEHGT